MSLHTKIAGTVSRADLTGKTGGVALRRHLHAGRPLQMQFSREKIGGGGWVTGITISPDGVSRMVRTDVGGGWRWDSTADKWQSLISDASMPSGDANIAPGTGTGIQGLAAANSVAFMAYIDAIYKSTDRGVTWTKVKTGITTGANSGNQRWWGPHLVIDPNNNSHAIFGSYSSGLWYTNDTGSTWTQVPSGTLPFGTAGYGIPVVGIDGSGNWWAAPYGSGVWTSTDHGTTWTKTSSDAMFVAALGMAFGDNGDVVCTGLPTTTEASNPNVYRYHAGSWSAITLGNSPSSGTRMWTAVAADPLTPGRFLIQADGGYQRLSTDYGATWIGQDKSFTNPDGDVGWLPASNFGTSGGTNFTTVGGLQFDPVTANRVWMSQGIGVWYADIPSGSFTSTITWKTRTRGLEELVVNHVLAMPGDKPIAVCWDRPLFVIRESGDAYPTHYHPTDALFGGGWHTDRSVDTGTVVASMADNRNGNNVATSGYSTDGGHTWTPFPTIPAGATNAGTFGYGSVHISGSNVIWVGSDSHGAYYSTDLGTTWTKITTFTDSLWNARTKAVYRRPVAAEQTTGHQGTFYAYITSTGVYRSTDGGATWTQMCNNTQFPSTGGVDWSWNTKLKAAPDNVGHLFISCGTLSGISSTPFKRSTDAGVTWTTLAPILVTSFDFGKAAPGQSYPAIYAYGTVSSVNGLHRSIDGGDTWTLLSAYPAGSPEVSRTVAASKDTYGLVWIGTGGQGVIRGEYA